MISDVVRRADKFMHENKWQLKEKRAEADRKPADPAQ